LIRQRKKIKESSPKVPAYIVTFSDMVTLLLTFFVMLLTLARAQDPELYKTGRDSFLRSIRKHGLGILYSKKTTIDFGEEKIKYFINEPDKSCETRSIDAKEEDLRRIFKKISQSMKTTPSQIVAQKTNFSVTNIGFSPGRAGLNEPAKKFLTRFAGDLQQNAGYQGVKLYVLGLASDEQNEKKQWMLSAIRAKAVAEFMNNILPSQFQCPIYSWGAGPGGYWVTGDSLVSKQSQILIAVMRVNN
jgi:chemotaxis protein MotB